MSKIWFITGASRGFGRSWTVAALERGDKVAATARDLGKLKDLVDTYGDAILPIQLDVTDRAADFAAVRQAHAHFGRLDVVVNNAGYGHFGFVEEVTEAEARAQFDTNLFGALWVTQAAIPLMREQGSGHIVQISSIGGVAAFPTVGIYNSSKWALEGFSEALAQEVAGFGIKVTMIEPGGYATDWGTASAVHSEPHPAYQPMRDAMAERRSSLTAAQPGPDDTTAAVFAAIDAENPPRRLLLSGIAYDIAQNVYAERVKTWSEWEETSRSA
ncbi:SDR family oxidoreductase [Kutzneria kofuensis]|uniref:NAD(P)-dependent dehydrogenase (Short-subunit alcohol dehydrogenase family) n=1 Tax=Kutzneria kofuensis TaxID=103725 RepID=A0A7W9KSE9_9PSEU|nr:SDR family oxidoreductase [Kutzneria kofuensis]MBB5897805.1 NAD(P)-dependent dehydrogenase (short-subunit alcohol dehydrogenase family) [Kutzneria kofuensis]